MGTGNFTGAPQSATMGAYDIDAFSAEGGTYDHGEPEIGGDVRLTAGERLAIVVGAVG